MQLTLPDFSRRNLLIAGDVMLDRYWQGATSRISPEAPVPVVRITELEDRAGGAGNVALNIAALGGNSHLLGITGNDEAATALQQCLEAHHGVHCDFTRIDGHKTITKLRVLSRHQQLIRLDFEETPDRTTAGNLATQFAAHLPTADVVILSDYAKGTLHNAAELVSLARNADKQVIVDPKGHDFERYRHATLITPNMAEFEAVAGSCRNDDELCEKGLALCASLALEALLITRSEKGMTLLQSGRDPLHLPTHAREVYDVTGAGDTVVAVLSAALAAGMDFQQAAMLANHAAGIAVGKLGTATVSPAELRRALRPEDAPDRGVIAEEALASAIHQARDNGETIVMTNGCFDILHAGHIQYLEEARRHGDRLIVAVNSDESVRRLKGESRPINSLSQRMEVLAGLRAVDWVVPFSEDTPERLICQLLPDILIKGGDYRPEEIAGGHCVTANGGQVIVTGFVEGQSTSQIIDSVLQSNDH
jgi:D-beta-D-heptose 7-phosphate kinase/D-beta-D-heptose 1-phosphate adenosyltransferase